MIRPRYELKYLVTEAQVPAITELIRAHMRPDHHSAKGRYPLVSLYLDSPDLRLCRESLDGVRNRYKLRIRSYSDAPDAVCFFEIKRRINQVIVKSRARVPRWALPPLLAGDLHFSGCNLDDSGILEQFACYQRQICAIPIVQIRYLRQAFESRNDDDLRVTFDRRLSFKVTRTPELGLNGGGWQQPPDQLVILEIKFTRFYPRWIAHLVEQCGLRQQSMSKYAMLVRRACALHLYGLARPSVELAASADPSPVESVSDRCLGRRPQSWAALPMPASVQLGM